MKNLADWTDEKETLKAWLSNPVACIEKWLAVWVGLEAIIQHERDNVFADFMPHHIGDTYISSHNTSKKTILWMY